MHFDAGIALINSANRGISMRKAIALVLLIVLGTMPLQTSAQVSVPAVDLECSPSADLETNGTMVYENQNSSISGKDSQFVGGPLMWMDGYNPDRLNDTVICTVTNPNTYSERIQIQVSADGVLVSAPGIIDLGPNSEESFNVTAVIDQRMSPRIITLTVTATVVEANGGPPPNIANTKFRGDIYISTDYKYGGCYTVNTPWEIMQQWRLVSFDIFIGTGVNNTTGELLGYNANVTIQLNYSAAPLHSENFAILTWMGCYDELPIHSPRGSGVTTGDIEYGNGTGGHAARWHGYCNGATGYYSPGIAIDDYWTNHTAETCNVSDWTLPDESGNGLLNERGNIGMHLHEYDVNDSWNPEPNTGGSQFYFLQRDEPVLDGYPALPPHTVFASVIGGMEHIDAINQVETEYCYACQLPLYNVTILNANLWNGNDSDGDGTPDDFDEFPNDANETTDSDEDGVGDNSDAFPDDANETHDDDDDGVGNNSDAFPQDPEETHDDDGDGVGNNTDVFPQDPDEQFDNDGDGVGDNEDDFPDNKFASNWATIYAAVGTLLALLIGAGVMISRMKKQDELPTVASSSELQQLDKQIEELQQKKNEMIAQEDVTERMFNDD